MTSRRRYLACALSAALTVAAASAPPAVGQDDEGNIALLPDAEGRDITYVICSGCHSIRLVAQQGLTRKAWAESLEWMVEEQGMAELDPETHAIVLDYLAEHLGIDHEPPPPIQ